VAARALERLGISPEAVCQQVTQIAAGHVGHAAGRGRGGGPRSRLHRD
jgi:hypothetical protein